MVSRVRNVRKCLGFSCTLLLKIFLLYDRWIRGLSVIISILEKWIWSTYMYIRYDIYVHAVQYRPTYMYIKNKEQKNVSTGSYTFCMCSSSLPLHPSWFHHLFLFASRQTCLWHQTAVVRWHGNTCGSPTWQPEQQICCCLQGQISSQSEYLKYSIIKSMHKSQ